MNAYELKEKLSLYAACLGGGDKEISGCYIGDLMSLAMAKLQEGNVWVTIQTNVNVVAVSALTEAGCVIIADGFKPDEAALKKAEAENVIIFTTEKSAYETAKLLGALGI